MMDTDELIKKIGKGGPPTDKKLLDLLKKAYKGEILCHTCIIKLDAIAPYSDFKPKISKKFLDYFCDKLEEGELSLYVYQVKNNFIMSDNYNSYYLYKAMNHESVKCIAIGNPTGDQVVAKSEPYVLQFEPIFEG